MEEPYYRIYGDYTGHGPLFYPREECGWLAEVEKHWQTIRREFEAYYYERRVRLTPSYVPDDVEVRGWRSINFVTYRHWYRGNCSAFPQTVALLRSIPDLTSAFINLLEPHSSLPVHNGDTNTTYRCHLGLIIPPGGADSCGLEVGGHRRGWQEGEAFAFNEAYRHSVWNHTHRERVILVFDVLKPAYRSRGRKVCASVLGAIALTGLETNVPALRSLPATTRRMLHQALGFAAGTVLFLRDGVR